MTWNTQFRSLNRWKSFCCCVLYTHTLSVTHPPVVSQLCCRRRMNVWWRFRVKAAVPPCWSLSCLLLCETLCVCVCCQIEFVSLSVSWRSRTPAASVHPTWHPLVRLPIGSRSVSARGRLHQQNCVLSSQRSAVFLLTVLWHMEWNTETLRLNLTGKVPQK